MLLQNLLIFEMLDFSGLSYKDIITYIMKGDTLSIILALSVIAIGAVAWYYSTKKPKGCLDPKKFKEFKLVKRSKVSHDTDRFRFELPTPNSVLGLPVGQHIDCRGKDIEGKEVVRPYMLVTSDSDIGYFEIVVKMLPQGRMSHHFKNMREGDYLPVKIGSKARWTYKIGEARAIGMLAGGVGITPMFQATRAILQNPNDKTKIHLIYANKTVNDILLKEELDGFALNYPDQFKVYYVLSQPDENWNGGAGHISKEMIQTHCPAPAPGIKILICGPTPFTKAMAAHLNELGYSPDHICAIN